MSPLGLPISGPGLPGFWDDCIEVAGTAAGLFSGMFWVILNKHEILLTIFTSEK